MSALILQAFDEFIVFETTWYSFNGGYISTVVEAFDEFVLGAQSFLKSAPVISVIAKSRSRDETP